MISSSRCMLLGSALMSQALASVIPWEQEVQYDPFTTHLEARADDWSIAPPGAPPMHPGQSVKDYLANILDGDGTNPLPSKEKREYQDDGWYSSTVWNESSIGYNITVINGGCPSGLRGNLVVGPIDTVDGDYIENATASDIAEQFRIIQKRNPGKENTEARERANAKFLTTNAAKALGELNPILDYGWICDTVDPTAGPLVLHDELRRKLLEMNKFQYYTFIIMASSVGGFVVAGIQAGITHAYAEVELGAEAFFNSAVGIALSIFLATEFSRFAPRVAGAESWSPAILYAWSRRMVTRSGQALRRVKSSAGQMAGGGAVSLANQLAGQGNNNNNQASSSGGNIPGCITPEQARQGAEQLMTGSTPNLNLMEQGLPQGAVSAASTALSMGFQAAQDSSNIAAGQRGAGACRN